MSIDKVHFDPALGVNLALSTKTADGIYIRDTVAGTGPAVAAGQTLNVRYLGSLVDGTTFDQTDPAAPDFVFQLGNSGYIKGWNEGIIGANVGSTRQFIVPPELGYGSRGQGAVPPNAILVFSVTIDSAK